MRFVGPFRENRRFRDGLACNLQETIEIRIRLEKKKKKLQGLKRLENFKRVSDFSDLKQKSFIYTYMR